MSSTPIYDELAARYLVDVEPVGRERPEPQATGQHRPPSTDAQARERTQA